MRSARVQAGYAATGAYFREVDVNAWLPDASRFSREIGRLGFSLEMRTPALLIDLTIYACTDSACQPGGHPVTNRYRLAFKVYKRSTHAVVCSSAISTPPCPLVQRSWNRARFAPGHTVGLQIFSQPGPGLMQASVEGQRYLDFMPGSGLLINQVRIGGPPARPVQPRLQLRRLPGTVTPGAFVRGR